MWLLALLGMMQEVFACLDSACIDEVDKCLAFSLALTELILDTSTNNRFVLCVALHSRSVFSKNLIKQLFFS